MTRTLRCTVQYDGTAFAGFQRQLNLLTVQGALESALGRVTQETVTVVGAGRTDAGVHAVGQVVHFNCASTLPAETLQRAVNACLPDSVALTGVEEVPDSFHARFDARSREYRYLVENGATASPLWRQRAYHVAQPLSVETMQSAAQPLLGRHDFAAFGAPMEHSRPDEHGVVQSIRGGTLRTMLAVRCWRQQRFVWFGFVADAFLRHMVRILVGTLLRVGAGKLATGAMLGLLHGEHGLVAGPAAPAHGLYLVRIRY